MTDNASVDLNDDFVSCHNRLATNLHVVERKFSAGETIDAIIGRVFEAFSGELDHCSTKNKVQ